MADLKETCEYRVMAESLEQSHCSSNSTISEASSSSVAPPLGKTISGFVLLCSRDVAQSSDYDQASEEIWRRARNFDLDGRGPKPNTKSHMNQAKSACETVIWTDEKHRSYLKSIEAAFVRNMYDKDDHTHQFFVEMARPLEGEDDDCVESQPPDQSEVLQISFRDGGYPKRFIQGKPERYLDESNLKTSFFNNDKKHIIPEGKLRSEKTSLPVPFLPDIYRTTTQHAKRRKVASGQDVLDLELRLGDFRTRLFGRLKTPTFV